MVRYLDNQPPSPVSDLSRQHLENMHVTQARVYAGDVRFYVTTANGHVVRGPYLNREQAEGALEQIRARDKQEEADELTDEEYLARYGEPRGAGQDPAGRPDPRTHPEFWTE